MLDRHREEPSTAVGRARLAKLPEEPVLPEHVEQEERRRGEAIDDRRDDRVRQGCRTDESKQMQQATEGGVDVLMQVRSVTAGKAVPNWTDCSWYLML